MTCVVGVKDGNHVYIGADSAASSESSDLISTRCDVKVFRVGAFVIGFAGSFRSGQIIRFLFKPPKNKNKKSDYEYMCSDFITKLRSTLEKHKAEEENSSELLIAYNKELYYIGEDYQVGVNIDNYSAIGCSDGVALGALFAINSINSSITAEKKIEIALNASNAHCSRVLPPYNILSSNKKYKYSYKDVGFK